MSILNKTLKNQRLLIILHSLLILGLLQCEFSNAEDLIEDKQSIIEKIRANPFGMKKSISIDVDRGLLEGTGQKILAFDQNPDEIFERLKDQLLDYGLVEYQPDLPTAASFDSSQTSLNSAERIRKGIKKKNIKMRIQKKTGSVRQLKGQLFKKTEMPIISFDTESHLKIQSREELDKSLGREFLNSYKGLLRIDNPDREFKFVRRKEDELNRCHLRYSQFFRGLPVWPAELMVHIDPEGNVDLMSGAYIPTPRKIETKPSLDADQAIDLAVETIPSGESSEITKPELIIYASLDRMPRLAWKIELDISLTSSWLVVVDAHNGNVLETFDQVKDANVSGSGIDLFGEPRALNVWKKGSFFYILDTSKQMFNPAFDPLGPDSKGTITVFFKIVFA